jgi:hypothetical protein
MQLIPILQTCVAKSVYDFLAGCWLSSISSGFVMRILSLVVIDCFSVFHPAFHNLIARREYSFNLDLTDWRLEKGAHKFGGK